MSGDRRRVAELVWVEVPRWACNRSVLLGLALADGGYFRAWPRAGPLTLPVAAGVGLAVGATHPEDLYSYSLLLTTLLAAISSLGASLGVWALAGFVLGDLTLARRGESTQLALELSSDGLRALGALTVTYLVLAGLLVLVPLLAGSARIAIGDRLAGWPWGGKVASASLVTISAGLAFLWTQSTPFLIRPVWSYFDLSPDVSGIEPLQQRGWILAIAVALAAGGRQQLERAASWSPSRDSWVVAGGTHRPATWWLSAVGRSLFVTIMLSGMFATLLGGAITFLVLLAISVLHLWVLPRFPRYVESVRRMPVPARLAAIVAIAYLLGELIVERARDRGSDSFIPVIVATMLSLLVIAALLPDRSGQSVGPARDR
jgi:hypothetical protein